MLGGDTYSREPEDELMMNMMDFDQGLKQKSAIEQMIQLWIREDAVPELMPFDYDVCELVTQKLEEQAMLIKMEKSKDPKKAELMSLEVERMKFALKAYLRVRLEKINRYARFIAADKEQKKRLSIPEQDYAEKLARIVETHYFKTCLERLDSRLHSAHENEIVIEQPDLEKPVFIKVLQDIGSIIINGDQELQLQKDCVYCIKYRHIAALLKEPNVIEFV